MSALADYVQAALMLNYNQRRVLDSRGERMRDSTATWPREGHSRPCGSEEKKKLSLSSGNLSRKIVVSSGKTLLER